MRLISPDYDQELSKEAANETLKEQGVRNQGQGTTVQDSPLSKLPKKTLSELSLMKSRSRENIARLEVRLVRLDQISQLKKQFNKNLSSYIYQ